MAVLVTMLMPEFTISYADGGRSIRTDEPIVNGSQIKINGEINSGEQGNLFMKVTRQENEIYNTNQLTDSSGKFAFDFEIPQMEQDGEYEYQIGETEGESAVEEIFTDDFSTSKSYVVKGEINNEIGHEAPSAYLENNARQLKALSTSPTGMIDLYADFYITSKDQNTTLITATASSGDKRGIDTDVNHANMFNAFEVNTSDGNIILRYADNAISQDKVITKVIQENFEVEKWYNIHLAINFDTLELKAYIDGNEVLAEDDKYIFKQLEYQRIFDTKKVSVPIYLDNLRITKTTPYEMLGLETVSGSFTVPAYQEPEPTPIPENTYNIQISDAFTNDHTLTVTGMIEPKKDLPLVLTVKEGETTVASEETTSSENGDFEISTMLPKNENDTNYTVTVALKEQQPTYKVLYNDDFSTKQAYLVSTNVEYDASVGHDAPSAKLVKGSRLLKTLTALTTKQTGVLIGEMEFMKPDIQDATKLWAVFDDTGNNMVYTVYSRNGSLMLQYRDADDKSKSVSLLSNYETDRWYTLKGIISLNSDKRYFDFYIDGVKVCEQLPISDKVRNITRVLDVQSAEGSIYVDNAKMMEDITVYLNVNPATIAVCDAGEQTLQAFLDEVASSSVDTIYSVLEKYKGLLYLDLDVYREIKNSGYINREIAGKRYSSMPDFRKSFNSAAAFAVIKESNSGNIVKNISDHLSGFKIFVPENLLNTNEFKDKILANLNTTNSIDDMKALIQNSGIFAALKTSTQFKVKEVIDEYKTALQAFGLSGDFFMLSDAQAITASKAVFESTDSGSNVEQLLRDIVSRINAAVKKVKNQNQGGSNGRTISSPGSGMPNQTVKSTPIPAKESGFDDLQSSHWAYNAVMSLVQKKIMEGTSDSTFDPNANTTREQFVKIIVGTLNTELSDAELSFKDADPSAWYYRYLCTAVKQGLINGLTEDSFGIGNSISRQDAATILYRARESFNLSEKTENSAFADDEQISDYAKEAVYFLKNCGVLSGNDNNEFMPTKSLSRAEAAMLFYNVLNFQPGAISSVTQKPQPARENKAEMLLEALDIKPDFKQEYVTKGEWAASLAKILKLSYGTDDSDYFNDIANSEYRDAINALTAANIIPKGESYYPNQAITLSQALQNAVYALGWGMNEEYLRTATSLGLSDSIKLGVNDTMDRDSCIRLLYNLLNANYLYDNHDNTMTSDESHTLLGSYYNVVKIRGRVTATEDAILPDYSGTCGKGQIMLDHDLLYTGNTDIGEYLGYKLEVFAKEDDDVYTVLCYTVSADNKILLIDVSDVDTVAGFDSGDNYEYRVNPYIQYYINNSSKTVRLSQNSTVLYNNIITQNITNEDFIGDSGTLMLVDSNDDGKYDIASLKRYQAYIVAGYDSASGTVSFKNSKFILDISSIGEAVVYKNGRETDAGVIKEDDVLCLYGEKLPENQINHSDKAVIYISTETISGVVDRLDSSDRIAIIGEKEYKVSKTAMDSVSTGKQQKFYLDICSVIVKAEDIADGIDYAYVLNCFENEDESEVSLRYLATNNQKRVLPLSDKVRYTGYDETGNWIERKGYKPEKLFDILKTTLSERTLVKLEVSEDKITSIIMAEDMTQSNDYKGYTENKFTLDDYATSAVTNNGVLTPCYGTVVGMTLMLIDYEDNKDDTEFVYYAQSDYNTISHLSKMVKEMYVYDSNENLKSNVCVLKVNRDDQLVSTWNINTQSVVVVDSVNEAIGDDNELTYLIQGFANGQSVSYYTVDMNVGEMFNTYWSAQSSKSKVSELSRGDVIRVAVNSSNKVYTVDILSCVCDFKNYAVGYGGSEYEYIKTTVGPVWKNYDNKTLRLIGEEEKVYRIPNTVYLCDLRNNTVSAVGKGVYINDSDTDNPDYVFIRKRRGETTEMVIYRW